MDRKKYQSTWQAPPGSGRTWEVGYVRSPRWTEQNNYGETLGDLSKIIRKAPEAKRCLMKRLTEYMLGEDQTVDGGYLDDLTAKFRAGSAEQFLHRDEERDASASSRATASRPAIPIRSNATIWRRAPSRTTGRPAASPIFCRRTACPAIPASDVLNTLDLSKWIAAAATPRARPFRI